MGEVENDDAKLDASLIGKKLAGYRVTGVLGRGAMCVVYRAHHVETKSESAIKVLWHSRSQVWVDRLRREARATWHLDHPSIIKNLGGGIVPGKFAFLVMELARGRTLQDVLHEHGPFSPDRAARITSQLASAIGVIHRAGYVHRDLKPGNIMVEGEGEGERVKILDFGLATIPSLGYRERRATPENLFLGTPAYMAPEQVESPHVGPSADLYALGAILYHLLAGQPPFEGSMLEVATKQLIADAKPLGDCGGLEALAHRLLEKEPEDRLPSAEHVLAQLYRWRYNRAA